MTIKKTNVMLLSIILILSWQLQAQTCNSDITLVSPTSRFATNGDGIATDNQTGLMWMRCSLGQTWSGATCTGTATLHSWKVALEEAESTSFAGNSDWRLPNIKELNSIVEAACFRPAINETIFPATASGFYWSSSSNAYSSDYAWGVDFDNGNDETYSKDYYISRVRLVRAGQ